MTRLDINTFNAIPVDLEINGNIINKAIPVVHAGFAELLMEEIADLRREHKAVTDKQWSDECWDRQAAQGGSC